MSLQMQDWLHLSNNLTTNIPKLFCLSLPLRLRCLKKIKIQVGWKECKTKFSLPLHHLLKATSLSHDVIFLAHIVWAVSSTLDFDYKMVLSSAVSFSWWLFLVVVVCMLVCVCVCVWKELCLKHCPCTSPYPSNMLFRMLKWLQELSKAKHRNSSAGDAVD